MSEIIPIHQQDVLITTGTGYDEEVHAAGAAADAVAKARLFADERSGLTHNTRRRHSLAVRKYAEFLRTVKREQIGDENGTGGLYDMADRFDEFAEALGDLKRPISGMCWGSVTYGLMHMFKDWLLETGYAIGSVNVFLSTIRKYTKMAFRAGLIDEKQYLLASTAGSIPKRLHDTIDDNRDVTRIGNKKATATVFSEQVVRKMFDQGNYPATAIGMRNWLIVCLLAEHALRASELVSLKVEDINVDRGYFTVYRRKVGKMSGRILMLDHTFEAIRAYKAAGHMPEEGPLIRRGTYGHVLSGSPLSETGLRSVIRGVGKQFGIERLSPHDFRHAAATSAGEDKTNTVKAIQSLGGWTNPTMALHYMNAGGYENEGLTVWGKTAVVREEAPADEAEAS